MQLKEHILSSGIVDRVNVASKSLFMAITLGNQDVIKTCQEELNRLMKVLDQEADDVTHQDD
jgi:hypothetical protein